MSLEMVLAIEEVEAEEWVYDPCCGEPHSYISNGLVSHNCVLFIDEIEKAMGRGGGNDGGTTSRVFGNFLTWLSDKTAPVFVVCTANSTGTLPPEFLRAGRFDAIFFTDLPTLPERVEICKVMAARYGRKTSEIDWDALAIATDTFSGAEIEASLKSAMYVSFSNGVEVTTASWLAAIKETIPLSSTMGAELAELREWAKNKAIPANSDKEIVPVVRPPKPGLRRIGRLT